jgi:hypothetical protein
MSDKPDDKPFFTEEGKAKILMGYGPIAGPFVLDVVELMRKHAVAGISMAMVDQGATVRIASCAFDGKNPLIDLFDRALYDTANEYLGPGAPERLN